MMVAAAMLPLSAGIFDLTSNKNLRELVLNNGGDFNATSQACVCVEIVIIVAMIAAFGGVVLAAQDKSL